MSQSQAETLAKRRGAFKVTPSKDRRSVTVTITAPKDGAGRDTSAPDLTVVFDAQEFDRISRDCVFINAGLDRSR
jgi:hypothetical protein